MRTGPLVFGIACSALVGCAFDSDSDFAVVPTWAINGVAPTAEECKAFGVDHVEFRLTKPKSSRVIKAQCDEAVELDDGDYSYTLGGFVTTEHFEFGKSYHYELALVDAAGNPVVALVDGDGKPVGEARTTGTFEVYASDYTPWLLAPAEVFLPSGDLASFSGAWTVGPTLAEGCAALGITRVALELTTNHDQDLTHLRELAIAPCEAGSFASDGPVLAYGDYLVRYVALDARDAVVDESDFFAAVVDQAGELKFDVVRFDGVLSSSDALAP
jgi:hypothetical protein